MKTSSISDLSQPITSLDGESVSSSAADAYRPSGDKSRVAGPCDEPLWHATVPEVLAHAVRNFGARDAVVFPAQRLRWSYYDLLQQVEDLAAGFLALGLKKGDRVAIWAPNRPEWVAVQFATAQLGIVLVTINPAYRIAELEYALNKVECQAIVTAASFKSSNYIEMLKSLAPELDSSEPGRLNAVKLPHLKFVIRTGSEKTRGMLNYDEVKALGGPAQKLRLGGIWQALDPDEAINIQFTSGTTGAPKGATLTHANIVNNARFTVATMGFTETDKLCIPVPLYHCFGMVLGSLGCVTCGAAMVFPDEAFAAEATLQTVQDENCSALYGVPTMFVALLEQLEVGNYQVSSLRTGMMAGAPCPIEIMKRVVEDLHMSEVTIGYGMTETSPISFQTHVDDPIEKKVATVGRIHPHVEVKIVDEQGAMLPLGARGELCTRGYSIMQGYWNDEARTRESIDAAGWMHTGDLAILDEAGYCKIVGRVKDMLIRGGENVYPREIEEFLFRHPKVQEAQVFGVPDEKFGEEICAWIVTRGDAKMSADELREFCKDQIAHYKVPRYIRFKSSLPMTVTGKPQKFLMRDAMIEELGLVENPTA